MSIPDPNADLEVLLGRFTERVRWTSQVNSVLVGIYADQARKDFFYASAGATAGIILHSLFHELVMSVSRLLDPADTRGKKNLSLPRIQKAISAGGHPIGSLKTIGDEVAKRFEAWKPVRDKMMAHYDLEVWIQERPKYTGVNRNSGDAIVNLLNQYILVSNRLVRNVDVDLTPIRNSSGRPEELLRKLGFMISSNEKVQS